MNLPSIFKNGPSTKNSNLNSQNASQDDLFGLGIQVFKIQSKKQPPKPHSKKNISGQQIRQQAKIIQRATAKSGISSLRSHEKKVPGPLPKLNSSKSGLSEANQSRTDSILSKKKIERANSSSKKLESIKEFNPLRKAIPQKTTKSLNKSIEAKKEIPKQSVQKKQTVIKKVCWIDSLSEVTNFYNKQEEFEENQFTKVGRKKNADYLTANQSQNFVEAYSVTQPTFFGDQGYSEEQELGIEQYSPISGFKAHNYHKIVLGSGNE